jgi:hypothetical protein
VQCIEKWLGYFTRPKMQLAWLNRGKAFEKINAKTLKKDHSQIWFSHIMFWRKNWSLRLTSRNAPVLGRRWNLCELFFYTLRVDTAVICLIFVSSHMDELFHFCSQIFVHCSMDKWTNVMNMDSNPLYSAYRMRHCANLSLYFNSTELSPPVKSKVHLMWWSIFVLTGQYWIVRNGYFKNIFCLHICP